MAKLIIDGKEYEAKEGRNCLEAALDNGLDIPYFCYHAAMGSVGSCRLCAVKTYKDEDDKQGRIVMSCMEPVTDGKRLSINDPETDDFRRGIIELLMINHPHDCPICDEGGECHLQDMTVMTGHRTRRYRGKKRTYNNQYLGPLINHEMNRCIQCYRCTRYYQDYAGGHDLVVLKQHNNVYFGRHEEGILESPFSGNLIDICPTGVFTDKTLKDHYVRKWDQESAPSICTQCSMGCNIIPSERYGKLRRILPRYNKDVNGYFICDRGRFGYAYHNSDKRLREPLVQENGSRRVTDRSEAWEILKGFCQESDAIVGIGSPRASLESNFALQSLVGRDNFSNGLSDVDHELLSATTSAYLSGNVATPRLPEVEASDAVFLLGADVTNEVARQDLAIRQAVKRGASLWIASSRGTNLDEVGTERCSLDPEGLLQCATQIREQLLATTPEDSFAGRVASALKQAKRPLILVGWHHGLQQLIQVAHHIAEVLQDHNGATRFLAAVPEANSLGVALLGGVSVGSLLTRIEAGEVKRLIVLENNLIRRVQDGSRLQAALKKLERLLVLDHTESVTTSLASDVIPVTTSYESNGTWVSVEGRAGRAYQVAQAEPWVPEAWEVLRVLHPERPEWKCPEDVLAALATEHALFEGTLNVAPPPSYRQQGQKIPRMPHRFSGRTAMPTIKDVQQHLRPPPDPETPFNFSMEGSNAEPPSSLIPRFWAPNWNSQEAINKFQVELGARLHGGSAGKRLIEADGKTPAKKASETEATPPPSTKKLSKDQVLLVPSAELFGSDPLSRESEAIAELMPEPYVELHPTTAEKLNLSAGSRCTLQWDQQSFEALVKCDASVAANIGVIPARFSETRHIHRPCIATLKGAAS